MADGDAHLALHLEEHLGWLGGATAGEQSQRRDDRRVGLRALLGQVHLVEGRPAAGHRGALAGEELDGGVEGEVLDQDRPASPVEQHDQVVGPGDVGEREGDRAHVVGRELHGVGQTEPAGQQRAVGVLDALGGRGGARRVVDPAHLVAAVGWRGQRGGVADGQVVVGHHHGRGHPGVVGDPRRHLDEVEALPRARHEEELGLGLRDHEPDLTVAVDRDDRVLDRTEPGEGQAGQDRLDACRQLPGDPRAVPDAQRGQPGGDPLGLVAQPGEGDHAVVAVEQHRHVGRRARPAPRPAPTSSLPARSPVHCGHARSSCVVSPGHHAPPHRDRAAPAVAGSPTRPQGALDRARLRP